MTKIQEISLINRKSAFFCRFQTRFKGSQTKLQHFRVQKLLKSFVYFLQFIYLCNVFNNN